MAISFSRDEKLEFIMLNNYNQTSTKLAFHSDETSKDKLSIKKKLAIYYCHPGACQTTQKLVHFYMLITQKHKK